MNQEELQQFLLKLTNNPGDTGLAEIFADWLEEQGEHERADFIRMSCRVTKEPVTPILYPTTIDLVWTNTNKRKYVFEVMGERDIPKGECIGHAAGKTYYGLRFKEVRHDPLFGDWMTFESKYVPDAATIPIIRVDQMRKKVSYYAVGQTEQWIIKDWGMPYFTNGLVRKVVATSEQIMQHSKEWLELEPVTNIVVTDGSLGYSHYFALLEAFKYQGRNIELTCYSGSPRLNVG